MQKKADNTTPTIQADDAGLDIEHLLFATTAASKSKLVKDIHELSASRRKAGKFTVSADFWSDISGHIRLHPEIGRAFIPGFPGSTLLRIEETSSTHLAVYQEDRESDRQFQATVLDKLEQIGTSLPVSAELAARGDESDPRVVAILDLTRDRLQVGKSSEALELLEKLGDPAQFTDQFSRFRWHTNRASVALIEGEYDKAADMFLDAFQLAPDNEKAHANRANALLLKKDPAAALAACDEGLSKFPDSIFLWSTKVNARQLLGEADPDRGVPEGLRETPNLLAARARFMEIQGDYPGAVDLLKRCMDTDGGSLDARRAYLALALSWAAQDPVLAHHGQITVSQRESLAEAIKRLEPLEQTLTAIQSDHISLEVSNNATVTLMLLGMKDRALALATHLLARHPRSEGLLRLRLNELDERDDVKAIHSLTDGHLHEFPASVLGILAEISANHGDLAWHSAVMALAETSGMDPQELRGLRALSIHARWAAGNRTEAVVAAQTYLAANPEHTLARVMLGQMLKRLERESEALQQAEICLNQITAESHSFEVLKVADLLYGLRQFPEAGALYARLVHTPGDDEITHRLLICLVESDQRRRAQDMLDHLTTKTRALPAFQRIEANLARRMGDWARMRDILAQELERSPDDSGIAIGYVGALYRFEDKVPLTDYLARDPRFRGSPPENEFELSKYLASLGLTGLAIARMYRAYRSHPGSTQVASFYLSRVLTAEHLPELDPPGKVGPGTVVHLRSVAETRIIAIDVEPSKTADGWPELISPDSELAQKLEGLCLGDKAGMADYFGGREVEVVKLASLYSWVAEKAHDQVTAAAVPAGPLWSVRLVKEDGKLDIDALLNPARQRKEHVLRTFANYEQNRFPLSMLAKVLGSDPVTLLLEWPFKEATLFLGIGTSEELGAATEVLRQNGNRYVLDLLTIAEFVRHKSFDAVATLLGRPLVPRTVREHLLVLLQLVSTPRASATLGEQDGQLQMIETPPGYYENRESFLREMLRCIDKQCEVVPTLGPQNVTGIHRSLAEVLDNDSLDVLYLCIERGAVLISDDGALRLWAPGAGVETSMGVQPVLMEACAKGLLSKDAYADAVIGKLAAGHDFVSVRADDLLTIAKRTPASVSGNVMTALDSFRKPTLDIVSGVEVSREFLGQVVQRMRPRVAAEYGKRVLEVLQHERPHISGVIHRAIAETVAQALRRLGRKLGPQETKAFAQLLDVSKRPQILRLTPLSLAIRKIFKRRE